MLNPLKPKDFEEDLCQGRRCNLYREVYVRFEALQDISVDFNIDVNLLKTWMITAACAIEEKVRGA